MINHKDIEGYRNRLRALQDRLNGDRTQLKDEALRATGGEAAGGLSNVPLHSADLGSQDYEEEMTLSLLENEEQLIEEINGALVRIDQGTFGRCEDCGKGITKERLNALPYTRYCVACARKEQGEGPG